MSTFSNAVTWMRLLLRSVSVGVGQWPFRSRTAGADRMSSGYCRSIVENVNEGVLVVDASSGRIIDANPRLAHKLGYSRSQIASLPLCDILTESGTRNPLEDGTTLAHTTREATLLARGGSRMVVDLSISLLTVRGRRALCYVIRDASDRKAFENALQLQKTDAERRAEQLTRSDMVTGLPNRQAFKAELHESFGKGRPEDLLAVLIVDLDEFSSVNNSFGAHVGDAVLAQIGARLQRVTRGRGMVARVGNDEFAIAVRPISVDSVATLAIELQAAVSEPIAHQHHNLRVSACIGISASPVGQADADELLSHADLALHTAKAESGGSVRFFNNQMDEIVRRRLSLVLSLRQALERNELKVHYQPVVNIETRSVLSLEALVRWEHPTLGTVPPREFIAAAEHAGLIASIGRNVLRQVCTQVVQWRNDGVPVVPVAVNVSPLQFHGQSMVHLIMDVLRETGMRATDLGIEITEGALMNVGDGADELRALREAGVRVLVDDFGTGYSSLDYLRHLPLDTVKIDRSFIANLDTNPTDEAIVRAILAMTRALRLTVVAEGVEKKAQVDVLRRHGCQMAQGYYFYAALSPEKCQALLRDGASNHRLPVTCE